MHVKADLIAKALKYEFGNWLEVASTHQHMN